MSFSIVSLARPVLVAVAAVAAGAALATPSFAQTPAPPAPAQAAAPAPAPSAPSPSIAAGGRVFELRTYHCHPGRLEALNKRFRDHTVRRRYGTEAGDLQHDQQGAGERRGGGEWAGDSAGGG